MNKTLETDPLARVFWTLVIALALFASAVIVLAPDKPVFESFPAFDSEAELQSYLDEAWSGFESPTGIIPVTPRAPGLDFASEGGADYYTATNVQVQGVDELDSVKTDGEYLYICSSSNVTIMHAYPPEELETVSVIEKSALVPELDETSYFYLDGIFISGDRMAVVAYIWTGLYFAEDAETAEEQWDYGTPFVVMSVLDISDRADPKLLDWRAISGSFSSARMVGDFVYLVTQHHIWYDEDAHIMPAIASEDGRDEVPAESVHYDPEALMPELYINVLAYDIGTFETSTTSIMACWSSTMYMSGDNIYVAFTRWVGDLVVDDSDIQPEDENSVFTTIYKMRTDGLDVSPVASGDVSGWLLNQFSMDEYDSYLRVATTMSWEAPSNAVYVLDEDLRVVGELEDIAPEERIFSARFMGEMLYLVTFEQIDPLFVIDLSDPRNPELMGELVMPGFSSYLHPVGDGLLVGLGREDSSLKLSLFDVSDPTNPEETSKYVFGESTYSQAMHDHHAFTFDPVHGLLVLPVMDWYYYDDASWGFYVLRISSEDGIAFAGFIKGCDWESRSVVMDEYIYTITSWCVYASEIDGFEVVAEEPYGSYPWYWDDGTVEPSEPGL